MSASLSLKESSSSLKESSWLPRTPAEESKRRSAFRDKQIAVLMLYLLRLPSLLEVREEVAVKAHF